MYGSNTYPVDVSCPSNLLLTNLRTTSCQLDMRAMRLRYYAVTAIDRMGNESEALQQPAPTVTVPRQLNMRQLINRPLSKPEKKKKKKR